MIHMVFLIGQALLMALAMFWKVGWSLVLGFAISAALQAVVSKAGMQRALGRSGIREVALATVLGAASSSCSYASAAVSRRLFKKGAALVPTLAFLFASTNLVVELGIVLFLLMGWQFTAAEWLGGIVLIVIMAALVSLTYPRRLIEEAREHPEAGGGGHDHGEMTAPGGTLWAKLTGRPGRVMIAQNFAMDWGMLWKDLALGFLIAGALSAFVPDGAWQALFVTHASPWVQAPANALIGPLVAVISFVCSIGNVPMAAVLWGAGVSFRRRPGVPLCRSDRPAAAGRLSPLLRVEDGGLYRGDLLRDDGTGGLGDGCAVQRRRLDPGARSEYPRRTDAFRPGLHILAQPGVRRPRRVFILDSAP
jgi:uncharacterized membrane protein YraQ (UPF0718 family)